MSASNSMIALPYRCVMPGDSLVAGGGYAKKYTKAWPVCQNIKCMQGYPKRFFELKCNKYDKLLSSLISTVVIVRTVVAVAAAAAAAILVMNMLIFIIIVILSYPCYYPVLLLSP